MGELENRAITAYFRRFGENAAQPSVQEHTNCVPLYNVNGLLGYMTRPTTAGCDGMKNC